MQKLRATMLAIAGALAVTALGYYADASMNDRRGYQEDPPTIDAPAVPDLTAETAGTNSTTTPDIEVGPITTSGGEFALDVDNALVARFDPGGQFTEQRILSLNSLATVDISTNLTLGVGPEPMRASGVTIAPYTTERASLDFVQYGALEVHRLDYSSPNLFSTPNRAQTRAFPLLI